MLPTRAVVDELIRNCELTRKESRVNRSYLVDRDTASNTVLVQAPDIRSIVHGVRWNRLSLSVSRYACDTRLAEGNRKDRTRR